MSEAGKMIEPRTPVPTVALIDEDYRDYRNLCSDVRNFEVFKFVHLGMICEIKHQSLPAIARSVGFSDGQELDRF